MKNALINLDDIEHVCKNCAFGRMPNETQLVLCEKKGIMQPESFCKKFKYDPLKRAPRRHVKLSNIDSSEFQL